MTPTSGSVHIAGRIASLLELGAGFNPEMTGIENIYMNGTIMGLTHGEVEARLQDIIEFADIGDFINQPVKMYSSGMFARLAFSVNVNVEPEVLIVDEALSVGDAFFQQKCIYRMHEMQKRGVTVLFVSHALGILKAMCGRCIYLDAGKVLADGLADDVCDMYQNSTTNIKKKKKNIKLINGIDTEVNNLDGEIGFRIDDEMKRRLTQRSGGGDIEFTALDFYQEGERVKSQQMLTPLHLKVSGVVHKDIPAGTAIGVLCRDKIGNDVFIGNLNNYDKYLPAFKMGEKFVLDLEYSVPLMPGEYFFGLGAKPHPLDDYFYDRLFNAAMITITNKKYIPENMGGVVYARLNQFKVLKE